MTGKHTESKGMVDKVMDKIGALFGGDKAATAGKTGAGATGGDADAFVESAGISNRYELEAADIAQRRGLDARIQVFAAQMIEDHQHAKAQLQDTLATHPDSPDLPEALDARRRSMLEHLEQAPDAEFDTRYAEQQEQAHEEAVKLFESYVEDGDNAGLQRFAKQMLPTLQQHLTRAKALREKTPH